MRIHYNTKVRTRRNLLLVDSASADVPKGLHVISSFNPHVHRVMALPYFKFIHFEIVLLDFASVFDSSAYVTGKIVAGFFENKRES